MNKEINVKTIVNTKIDCNKILQWLDTILSHERECTNVETEKQMRNFLNSFKKAHKEYNEYLKLETKHKIKITKNLFLLNLRTYICFNKFCKCDDRNHHRMTAYNYKKMISYHSEIGKKLDTIANKIIKLRIDETENPKHNLQYIKFVKESSDNTASTSNTIKYLPIENLYDKIEEIIELNNDISKKTQTAEAARNKISQSNKIRMTYGDINYIGNNKAIFYFNRGKRGTQQFTNSMYSIKHQASDKDVVVIDDIVFTSDCRCDSSSQHKTMFPHYRVTCAVGLTCPANLTNTEKIIFARNHQASTAPLNTARSMLIRMW